MPDKPETWAWLATWLQEHWPTLYAAGLAGFIAALRVGYGGGSLRKVLFESFLCGAVTLAVSSGLVLFAIPSSTAPFFGGMVGLLGVEVVRAAAKKHVGSKVDPA